MPGVQTRFMPGTGQPLMLEVAAAPTICLHGAAGCGKTSLIEETVRHLSPLRRVGALVAHPCGRRDALRLVRAGASLVALTDARGRPNFLNPPEEVAARLDLLFIEQCAASPAERIFAPEARHFNIAVFSVAGGDDKAGEEAELVAGADLVVLSKADLLPLVRFDADSFAADVQAANPDVPVLQVCTTSVTGMSAWLEWIEARRLAYAVERAPHDEVRVAPMSEWWYG